MEELEDIVINNENAEALYNAVSGTVDLGVENFDEFLTKVQTRENRAALYDALKPVVPNLGDKFEDFEMRMVVAGPQNVKKKESSDSPEVPTDGSTTATVSPDPSSDTSGSEAEEIPKESLISDDRLSTLIDLNEDNFVQRIASDIAGTTLRVEPVGIGDAVRITDELGRIEDVTIDLQPFTEKGKLEEIEKLRSVLSKAPIDNRAAQVAPNKFDDYRADIGNFMQSIADRYPDFNFDYDNRSGMLTMSKGDDTVTIPAEPGDPESYQAINQFIYDNMDLDASYDFTKYIDNIDQVRDNAKVSKEAVNNGVYNSSYLNDLATFAQATGAEVPEEFEQFRDGTKKITRQKMDPMGMTSMGTTTDTVSLDDQEMKDIASRYFSPELVDAYNKVRTVETTKELVDRQKKLAIETFLSDQPNREMYKNIILQQVNEDVVRENEVLIEGMTTLKQYRDLAEDGYKKASAMVKEGLEGSAKMDLIPDGRGGYVNGIVSTAKVPSQNDVDLIKAANAIILRVHNDQADIIQKTEQDMLKSINEIEDAEKYRDAASKNYDAMAAAVNDFNKTSQNFFIDIANAGLAISANTKEALGMDKAAAADMLAVSMLRDEKRELEEQEASYATKLTYDEAIALGRKGEFALREFGTQSPYIVAAIATSGAGSAAGIGTYGTQAMIGGMFGTMSAGAKYDELTTRQSVAKAAKTELKELEKMKDQMPEEEYHNAKYDLERSIASEDMTNAEKFKSVLGTGIIEGTITGFLGTAPNAMKVMRNLRTPDQTVKRMLQTNYNAAARASAEIGKATGREMTEEVSIEALTQINDEAFLGDQADFSKLDDVAVTSIITSGAMNVPGTAYSTIITQSGITKYKTAIEENLNKIQRAKSMLANDDLTAVQRKAIHDGITNLSRGIADEVTKVEADVMAMGGEATRQLLSLSGIKDTLLKRAGVERDDNYEQANAKVKAYMNTLSKQDALDYREQLEAVEQQKKDIAYGIDYKAAIEDVFGEQGVEQAKEMPPVLTDQGKYVELYKQFRDKVNKEAEAQMATEVKNPAGNRLFSRPVDAVKGIADKYMQDRFGQQREQFEGIRKIDKETAMAIAEAYEAMESNPNDPQVKEAYEAMVTETMDQYKAFEDAGFTIEITEAEPYKSSGEMMRDIEQNNRMKILATEAEFGDGAITDQQREENPLLRDSGVKDKNGKNLLVNDVFRAIHDFYGHAELGNSFGPIGEENAWQVHARMFSPLARRAMTTETRGQNSWVNFSGVNDEAFKLRDQARKLRKEGKTEEANKLVEKVYEMMRFADQKIGLLPEQFSEIGGERKGLQQLRDQFGNIAEDIDEQIAAAEKALSKRYPGVKIVKGTMADAGAVYVRTEDGSVNEIRVDVSNSNERSIAHEVMHAVLYSELGDWGSVAAVTDEMMKTIRKVASPELLERLDNFTSQYELEDRNEEAISELFGIMASEYLTLDPPAQNLITRWLNELAKILGIRRITPQETVDLLNTLSQRVREGEAIEAEDVSSISGKRVNTSEVVEKQQKVGVYNLEYFADSKEFKALVDQGLVENNYSLDSIKGNQIAVHQPDNMFVGTVRKGKNDLFEGQGGVFYVTNTGNVWASGKEASAKALAKLINESVEGSLDGKGRMLLVRGTDAKLLSSTDGVKGGMYILEDMVDQGLIPRKDFRSSLIRVGKKYNVDFSGSTSSKAIKTDIENKFIKPDDSSFQKRGFFLSDLINDIAKTSEKARDNSKKIQEYLGYDKRIVKFSQAGVKNAIANVLTEKILNGLPTSHAYAVVEVDGPVEHFNDSETHPSYPWAIRVVDGSAPKLKLLKDRPHAVKDDNLSLVGGGAVSQGKLGLGQRGMGKAVVKQQKKASIADVKKYARDNNISTQETKEFLLEQGYTEAEISSDGQQEAVMGALDKALKSVKRGNVNPQITESAVADLQKTQWYSLADDTAREEAVREVKQTLGQKMKKAPTAQRVTGKPKPKKVTVNEYTALKQQIRLEARAARDAKKDLNTKRKALAEAVADLVKGKLLTTNQARVIINKASSVNLDNEVAVDGFIKYMDKVYEDSAVADRILRSNKARKKAKKNIRSKIGAAEASFDALNRLFSIDAKMIPADALQEYADLLDIFAGSGAVLSLPEVKEITGRVNKIFGKIDEELDMIPQLASTYESLADPDLGFAANVNQMEADGSITKEDADLMKKYKRDIVPVEKTKVEEQEPSEIVVRKNNVANPVEKKAAQRFIDLVESTNLSELSIAERNNIQLVLDNIEAGWFSHYGNTLANEMEAIQAKNELKGTIRSKRPLNIDSLIAGVKSAVQSGRSFIEYLIRQNPLYDIDTVLGNHNSSTIYNNTYGKAAKAYAVMNAEIEVIQEKAMRAEAILNKAYKNNPNKVADAKFRIMLTLLQREFMSNPGSNKVFSAYEAAKAVVDKYRSTKRYTSRDAKALQAIIDKYELEKDGSLERLEKGLTDADKKAMAIVDEINNGLSDKVLHTGAVIRGSRPEMYNNYVHHSVATKKNDPIDTITSKYNKFRSFSTKAGTVVERTGGTKLLNLDPIGSAMSGARETLTDYHMTDTIKTVFKTLNKLKADIDANPDSTEHQKDIAEALVTTFEDITRIAFSNDLVSDDIKMFNQLRGLGYKAMLASLPRAFAELTSNLGYAVLANPIEFSTGMMGVPRKYTLSQNGRDVMTNLRSEQTGKLFGAKVSGKTVDVGLFPSEGTVRQASIESGVVNKASQVRRMLASPYYKGVNKIADKLISTPDKAISRPLWFGSLSSKFKELTGQDIDFEKIEANDQQYMTENKEALDQSTKYADKEVTRAATSVNPFNSIMKNKVEPGKTTNRILKEANGFMTNFIIYEYTTARAALYALFNSTGEISRPKAARLFGATMLRMSSYYVMYQMFTTLFDSAVAGLFGIDIGDDEPDYKELAKHQIVGSAIQLFAGRNLGNFAKVPVSLGVEIMNMELLEDLRGGADYDPFKHGLFYSPVNQEDIRKGELLEASAYLLTGPYSPMVKTGTRTSKVVGGLWTAKKQETKDRKLDELARRTTLEILGNLGYAPLYKDMRRILLKEMFADAPKGGKKKKRAPFVNP